MQSKHSLVIILVTVLFLALTFQTNAQCPGVYFKPSKAQSIPRTQQILFDDFNNDGKKDLVSFSTNGANSSINLQLKTADGFQTTPALTTFNAFSENFSGKTGDVNADGLKDFVLVYNTAPRSIVVYLNNGSSGFTASQPTISNNEFDEILSVTDFNSDGKADILLLSNTRILTYRLAQTDNTFAPPVQLMTNVYGAFAGKFTNDNNNDIVATYFDSGIGLRLRTFVNQGSAIFTSNAANDVTGFQPAQVDDFNNDGILDLVSPVGLNSITPAIYEFQIYFASSQGVLTKITKTVDSFFYTNNQPLSGDFNGDGLKDIAFQYYGQFTIFTNRGSGTNFIQSGKTNLTYGTFLAGDNNGDNKDDIFSVQFSLLFNGNKGIQIFENTCSKFGQTKIVDFDNDGFTDAGLYNGFEGRWTNCSIGGICRASYWVRGLNDIPVPNDYDGDGKTDYAIYRKNEGAWYILRSSDGVWLGYQFGSAEDKPVASDFDYDGRADIAVYRPSTGVWYVIKSQTNEFFAVQFGSAADKPVPADFDGDNKSDFAVYRPSTGVWYILKSSDFSFRAVQFGLADDYPIPADFDLDGKADIAVFRDGVWYIYASSDNSILYYQLGAAGDIPFTVRELSPAYFAVYRPSELSIYVSSRGRQSITGIEANDKLISNMWLNN